MKRAALIVALALLAWSPLSDAGTAANNPPASGGGPGSISAITSTGGTVTITNPTGPTTNLEVSSGGVVFTNGVSTGAIQLASLGSASYSEGQLAYVATLKAVFVLQASTATSVPLVNVAASGKSGYEWVRHLVRNPSWEIVTAWTLDPSNTTGVASDECIGTSSACPLLTYAEHARRLTGAQVSAAVAVSVLSDQLTGDVPYYDVSFPPLLAGAITFTGTTVQQFTSTVTGYTPCTVGASAADDNELVDSAVPGGSWTAAGAMAKGLLVRRTSGTVIQAYALKDLGSTTLRISQPINSAAGTTFPNFAIGDTYEVTRLVVLKAMNVRPSIRPNSGSFIIKFMQPSMNGMYATGYVSWVTCYFTALAQANYGIYQNCCFNVSGGTLFQGYGILTNSITVGCAFIGTGATRYEFLNGGSTNFEGNITHLQGARMFDEAAVGLGQQFNFYDTTNFALQVGVFARIQMLGFVNGKGNTSKLAVATNAGIITFLNGTAGLLNASSTSDATPYQAGGTTSASPIALDANGNGVFQTQ